MRDADAALLFDFNGVIVDDEEQHRLALEEVLAEEGIALTREQYYSDYLGYDDRMSLVAAFQHAGRPLPAVRVGRLVAEKSRRYERLLEGSLTLVPGASEFVTRAADRFRLGVVSGALRREIDLVLDRTGLRGHFDVIVSAEDVARCKPDPAGYLAARAALGREGSPLPALRCDRGLAARSRRRARRRHPLCDACDEPPAGRARRRRRGVALVLGPRSRRALGAGGGVNSAADAPPPVVPGFVRIGPDEVTPLMFAGLQTGAVLARADVGVLAVTGPGAVLCVQGLLTNDIEKPGDDAFVYGALLTPKGMIVVDGWAGRHATTVTYTVPGAARERAFALLGRSLPPRLARPRDQSSEVAVYRLAGPHALVIAQAAGLTERLVAAGAIAAGGAALECARILAGWPRLGAEVDEKTIPQEVRFDEVGGVSYTKGCYTGQETVSRLHFRGHVNRYLRGLLFDAAPEDGAAEVLYMDREVGRVTSVMWAPEPGITGGGRWIGLALLRREVAAGAVVRAARGDARVVDLPFAVPFTAPA